MIKRLRAVFSVARRRLRPHKGGLQVLVGAVVMLVGLRLLSPRDLDVVVAAATALAALAALAAARESSAAARDARQSLTLHHRPEGHVLFSAEMKDAEYYRPEFWEKYGTSVAYHATPKIGTTPSISLKIDGFSGVHDVVVRWIGPDNQERVAQGVQLSTPMLLHGVGVTGYSGDAHVRVPDPVADLRMLSVECRDRGTNAPWVAVIPYVSEPRVLKQQLLEFVPR